MVSGVQCSERLEIPKNESLKQKNRLYDEYLWSNTQIKLDDLAKVFRKMCEKDQAEKKAKLAQKKDKKIQKKKDTPAKEGAHRRP